MKNGVMIQYFEWNLPADGTLWKQLKADAQNLHDIGVTSVWIPPAYKGTGADDVGYGVYDLYDLGEFDQKGTVRTKYGTKEELIVAIQELHKHQISVYLDAVMNHKAAADYTEKFLAYEVDPRNRTKRLTDSYQIEGWTGFNFPGRGDQYSDFKWHWYHFSGIDYNVANGKKAIYQIAGDGKSWSQGVDGENGNYDYLMFADIDFDHPEVVEEMKKWGVWVVKELGLNGFRLDAVKHIDDTFMKEFLVAVREVVGKEFYAVGEYWKKDMDAFNHYLEDVEHETDLFDVPLHYNMYQASEGGKSYDLKQLLEGTLITNRPELAVTFVDNHDSQKGSSLESEVQDWFKPQAYGLILLIEQGYPCIFYGDYYGVDGKESPHRGLLDTLLDARQKYAFGEQVLYFDHPNTVGFVRKGDEFHPDSGVAVLLSNGEDGDKTMNVGEQHAHEVWHEITGSRPEEIVINEKGEGTFLVHGGKLAVWVKK